MTDNIIKEALEALAQNAREEVEARYSEDVRETASGARRYARDLAWIEETIKAALSLIERGEVMYGVNDRTDPGIYEINKHKYVAENHCVKHGFGSLSVVPVLVIPLTGEET